MVTRLLLSFTTNGSFISIKKTLKCSASRTCLPINWRCFFFFACLLVLEFESCHHPNSCWQQFLRVFNPKSFNSFLLCIVVVLFILPSYLWLAGWMDDRSSTAAHITENVMCTVSAFACGRYIVVTCLIPISASQRWHLQLSGRYVIFPYHHHIVTLH